MLSFWSSALKGKNLSLSQSWDLEGAQMGHVTLAKPAEGGLWSIYQDEEQCHTHGKSVPFIYRYINQICSSAH